MQLARAGFINKFLHIVYNPLNIDFEENLKKIRLRKVINMANRPIKKFKSGSIEAAIWFNEREKNGQIVGFNTVSLRRSWRDRQKNIWRDEVLNVRKTDIPKLLVILNKVNEELLLNKEEAGEENE